MASAPPVVLLTCCARVRSYTEPMDSDRGIHYNPEFEIIASFGNGEVWNQDGENTGMLPYQVSYDNEVNPKYPGRDSD